jgi:pimeloyl-ACP methyl ester carboxylesterase
LPGEGDLLRDRTPEGKVADAEAPLKEFTVSRRLSTQRTSTRTHGLIGRVARSHAGYTAPHFEVWFHTEDNVRLAGTLLAQAGGDVAVVVVHGFNGYRTKPKIRLLAEGFARRFPVLVFDLRGHGDSEGWCTGGELEALDVHAAVEFMRRRGYKRVVTVGASLGGIAVILAAGGAGDADAVVAISTPARWGTSETKAVRRMTWVFTHQIGRTMFRRLFGTRINLEWGNPAPPVEAVAKINAPILIVHGADDHFFPPEDAEALFANAPDPKRLQIMDRFGHAEDGFTESFAADLCEEIVALLALAPGTPDPVGL